MYWHIGKRVNHDVFGYECIAYDEQIVVTVLRQLQMEY